MLCSVALILCGCGGSGGGVFGGGSGDSVQPGSNGGGNDTVQPDSGGGTRDATAQALVPEAPGTDVVGVDGKASIDISNVNHGYITVTYTGDNKKPKLQITFGDQTYTYDLMSGTPEVFPLTSGDGTYEISVLEHVAGTVKDYMFLITDTVDVKLENEFEPFLYPNQYVNFTPDSKAVQKGQELAQGAKEDLEVVERVYSYVVQNTTYDYDEAERVQTESGYLPVVDEVLETKKGICFDYAALMTAMLRSQRIPTRLVIGYVSGDKVGQQVYHAWISVYIEGQGWIDNIIEFNGQEWVMMNPTLASTDEGGDENQYNALYYY